jgi:hypothetical protein
MSPEAYGSRITSEPDVPIACPVAIVVNRGHYAITDVYARFRAGTGGLLAYGKTEHFSSWWNLGGEITAGVTGPERNLSPTTLTPADAGLRFLRGRQGGAGPGGQLPHHPVARQVEHPVGEQAGRGPPGRRRRRLERVNLAVTVRWQQFAGHRRPRLRALVVLGLVPLQRLGAHPGVLGQRPEP